MDVHSFAPAIDCESRVLILGSMPGRASLRAGEYYAHSRNLFWRFMEAVLGISSSAPYEERIARLLARRVALWDVLRSCTRAGSLDSDILSSSIVPNDFVGLFESYPSIHTVFFNGAKAAASFQRHVLPGLPDSVEVLFGRLPSTSPANAAISFDAKLAAWGVVARAAKRAVAADAQQLAPVDAWYRSGGGRRAPALGVGAVERS
jgi:TDG/mug DNA glycosylase family protein